MIYEAKADEDFEIFGTFRPLGTSERFWLKMGDLPTVYAKLPADQTEGEVNVYDNPELTGEALAAFSVARLLE